MTDAPMKKPQGDDSADMHPVSSPETSGSGPIVAAVRQGITAALEEVRFGLPDGHQAMVQILMEVVPPVVIPATSIPKEIRVIIKRS